MARELAKSYDPKEVEGRIYRAWEASGFFNPDNLPAIRYPLSAKPFTIIMPPPNASGALHIGNAVFVTLEDIMIRFQRMRGARALWLPGIDHAGFEAQVIYDKKLQKEGRNRFTIPRDQLYREMFAFAMENKVVVENQLKKLGASCDWSRERFTLDPEIVAIVTDTFVKLYNDGLLYRGERIVNWCVKHQTTLSDLEVKHEERTDPLYYITYGPLELATVRPETKFGDTAVAVHPSDKRYKKYIGKELEIETLLGPAKIKVIADSAVDPKFGTGVIKVTPAHDPTDFEIGKRHSLEVRPVIGKDGRLNEKTGPYAGLKVAEAREKVAADMQSRGLITKIDRDYKHNVAVCYKCGSIVEPLVMPQWFVAMTSPSLEQKSKIKKQNKGMSLRDVAVDAVKSGKITFIPKRTEKVFFHWMKNLKDWNISRQISWGIRIPAWFTKMDRPIDITYFVHGTSIDNEKAKSSGHFDVELSELGRRQVLELKKAVAEENFDVIFSSDLRRAWQTAEGAFGGKYKIVKDKRLREIDYGVLTRADEKKVAKLKEKAVNKPFPQGESYRDVERRVRSFLVDLSEKYQGKRIAIVAHQGPQLALDVLLRWYSWPEAFKNDWRNTKSFQYGWNYVFEHLIQVGAEKPHGDSWVQDPDVLDTWFSSGQWPFATLMVSRNSAFSIQHSALSQNHSDFETYYPTDVMETGYDILFFWVARMIMLGLYRTGKVPFKTVYLHGLVRDKDRQKMSKSKGNVIDPLGVAEQYGTDAVRMALTVGNLPGNDIVISEEKIRGYRNFANKLWNIHRFIMMRRESIKNRESIEFAYSADDKKRLKELAVLVKKITADLEAFKFHHAAETLYHYTWHTFADKVIESAKPRLESNDPKERARAQSLLLEIHSTVLKLLHPFMPFVTEALWQDLIERTENREQRTRLLMVEPWPKY